MLAGLFRGAFIIGILAWYSISVWKMIDGYFRDQFASYLHEEYRKNPHMRKANNDDTKKGAVNLVGKNDVPRTDMDVTLTRIDELERAESCPVDKVENDDLSVSCDISVKISKVDGRTNDDDDDDDDNDDNDNDDDDFVSKRRNSTGNDESNDVDDGKDVDKDDDDDDERRRTMKSTEKMADEERRPIKKEEEFLSSKEFEEEIEMKRKKEREEKKRRRRKRKEEEEEEEERTKRKKKKMKRVKTITLNEEDFLSVKNRRGHPMIIGRDEDFWEFEEDEDRLKVVGDEEKGILISDLPFKPKLDVGRLERITPDEYCPLTLDDDDELSCDETTEWP